MILVEFGLKMTHEIPSSYLLAYANMDLLLLLFSREIELCLQLPLENVSANQH